MSPAMRSWDALPERLLADRGTESAGLLARGLRHYRAAAQYLHGLPYGRNSNRSDYRLVLKEGRGTCSTKHALLAAVALEQGLPVFLTIGIYDMSEANTPGVGPVLSAHGLDRLPEAHCYLTYRGQRVDVTRGGVSPREEIAAFHREWRIRPAQIGAHKQSLHQAFLREWLGRNPDVEEGFEALWEIREACIAALASSGEAALDSGETPTGSAPGADSRRLR